MAENKPEISPEKKAQLKKIMSEYMTEYYKSEIAFVKQVIGLLDHVSDKKNLLDIKKVIDNKLS